MESKSDAMRVFSRVPASKIDSLMANPELVLATVEDMGFDPADMMKVLSGQGGDPGALYYLMEGRWSGEESNFSFEQLWDSLKKSVANDKESMAVLSMIENEGRSSEIFNEHGQVRVLSNDQVNVAHSGLQKMTLMTTDDSQTSEESQTLQDLFEALKTFFSLAVENEEFVLVSLV